MKKAAFTRQETIVISEETLTAVCMAVVILHVTAEKIKLRSFDGWHGTVSDKYMQPLPRKLPFETDQKTHQLR